MFISICSVSFTVTNKMTQEIPAYFFRKKSIKRKMNGEKHCRNIRCQKENFQPLFWVARFVFVFVCACVGVSKGVHVFNGCGLCVRGKERVIFWHKWRQRAITMQKS